MSTKIQLTSSSKKRRVVSKPSDSPSSVSSPREKRNKTSTERVVEIKPKPAYDEEKETEVRTISQDVELHRDTCGKVRSLFEQIRDLKHSGRSENASKIAEKRTEASVLFITLKKLNRLSHLRCKKARDQTQSTKQRVDGLHLQLQNLLYEVMHLQKEIKKCLEFESNDEKIELVDLATFYREAPLDISMPSLTENDPHKQRLARLDWEREQRKQLAEQYEAIQNNRDEVDREITTKKEYLESLQPRLKTILESTLPVQEHLSMPFEEVRSQHQMARLLPRPLYILYVQSSAYSEACDKALAVKIEGDAHLAKAATTTSVALEEDSDSDNEENLTESKRRRKTVGDKLEEKRKKALSKHPLQIVMHLMFKGEACLILTFSYLMELHIVTVVAEIKEASGVKNLKSLTDGTTGLAEKLKTLSGSDDLLCAKTILNCLYPGDNGTESPNPSTAYQLPKIGIASLEPHLDTIGSPYHWCQALSGLDFLNSDDSAKASTKQSSSHMEVTIKAIRTRVKARLALQKQTASFSKGLIPVPTSAVKLFPSKLSSRLVSWRPVTEEDVMKLGFVNSHPSKDTVGSASSFYLATCDRKSAKIQAVIILKEAYPVTPPMFMVKLDWQGVVHMASNDHDIMDMEAEVNLHSKELITPKTCEYLLSCQLQRLLQCLDLYLEACCAEEVARVPGAKVEFPKEKMFVRNARGRSRGKPYKYSPQYGYFSQR